MNPTYYPLSSVTTAVPQTYLSQENVVIAEYSFFYKVWNDLQIYHITCKEFSFETVSHLLSNHGLTQNYVQSNDLHVFYYQQPDDKKLYQIICELVSYKFIIDMLNRINYGIELYDQRQENLDFSREYKENLEFYLKQDLIYYLAPNRINDQLNLNNNGNCGAGGSDTNLVNISQQHIADINFNQLTTSQNVGTDYTQQDYPSHNVTQQGHPSPPSHNVVADYTIYP